MDSTFGEFLAFLRKRARMTQSELGRAVGYSREQITRLEKNQRAPDPLVIAARFLPALHLEREQVLAARLMNLASPLPGSVAAKETQPTGKSRFNNLPAPLLPIVGRDSERAALALLLCSQEARLVTITGTAGVGKTRLAVQIAADISDTFADGVCFVSLASLADPLLVAATILQTLVDDSTPQANPMGYLLKFLRDKQVLLVLDNFEQLLAAGLTVSELLSAAPRVKFLVTSRAPLRLYGEFRFPIASLPLPPLVPIPHLDGLGKIASVALFVTRTRQANPSFELTSENAGQVAALCVQLDGLPLAIELAAAQLHHYGLQDLADGLRHSAIHFEFPARNVPTRHHSLTHALAWSYDHLPPEGQRAFDWLGVFPGGATAEMLDEIRGASNALENLNRLVEVSLAQADSSPEETRYTLLETVREFAREKLEARGELRGAEQRHATYFLALAERIEPLLTGASQREHMQRLARERSNLRRALAVILEGDEPALGLRFCNALWKFWRYRCELAEGYDWMTRALQTDPAVPAEREALTLRAGAEWGAGLLASVMQKQAAAVAHLEESLRLWQRVEEDMGVAAALTALGARRMETRDFDEAIHLQTQALELYARAQDDAAMAYAHNALGETWRAAGKLAESREHYLASLELARAAGHERSIAVAQSNLASVELAVGDAKSAQQYLLASLPVFRALDDRVNIASCIATLACATVLQGLAARTADNPLADDPSLTDRLIRAAQWFGFAAKVLADAGGKYEAADESEIKEHEQQCRAALGPELFQASFALGQTRTLDEIEQGFAQE